MLQFHCLKYVYIAIFKDKRPVKNPQCSIFNLWDESYSSRWFKLPLPLLLHSKSDNFYQSYALNCRLSNLFVHCQIFNFRYSFPSVLNYRIINLYHFLGGGGGAVVLPIGGGGSSSRYSSESSFSNQGMRNESRFHGL